MKTINVKIIVFFPINYYVLIFTYMIYFIYSFIILWCYNVGNIQKHIVLRINNCHGHQPSQIIAEFVLKT